jgi:hypothetical protein
MNGNVYENYKDMVNRIASEYSRKFVHSEREDVAQTLWLWFASHPRKTEEWLKLEDQKDADKLFAKSLRNAALDYCLKEKAAKEGYEYDDVFWYTKGFIKLLLPGVLSDDFSKVQEKLTQTNSKSSKNISESNDWIAYFCDIKAAFDKLSVADQDLVAKFYGQDVDGEQLHEELGGERPTARATMMQANRALNKMVKNLGGFPPFKDYDNEKENHGSVLHEEES